MSLRLLGFLALVLLLCTSALSLGAAQAAVEVRVDKSTQRMQVFVDGDLKHTFVVSTGLAGGPPVGTFKPQRMERTWHSRLFNMAPMPYSIFFHGHYAIHGTTAVKKLGQRASKGCVRLHPNNAAILFDLVKKHGMTSTRIVIEPKSSSARTAELGVEPKPELIKPELIKPEAPKAD